MLQCSIISISTALAIEHLMWQLPYGPPTEALLLKPAGATGKLPAVLALHDHGGNKYFGTRKITRTTNDPHPLMITHQNQYYGGVAWANELARRGYVVLVPDAFTFGSRRVRVGDLPDIDHERPGRGGSRITGRDSEVQCVRFGP
jgi:dienelactone hydrolase